MLEMRNLGRWDRVVRLAIGGALLAISATAAKFELWALAGAIVGGALLATGLVGSCMLYSLLGLRTSRRCSR
ncbi:MAG TPA: DUF2892 domain-containing protein [Gemmatimonadota bacterium]|nr:DUF2892 domain-containing protein [Gemmatimonadota bacterium]